MAGAGQAVKALRAMANLPKSDFSLKLFGVGYNPDGDPFNASNFNPFRFQRDGAGYASASHHLGLGTWHMVLVSRKAGLMPVISEESVWQELSSVRHTTPILREWAAWLTERLVIEAYITEAVSWGCKPGVLTATAADLDAVVALGVRSGALKIPAVSGGDSPGGER